jgi:hypothetical protein
LSLSTRGFIGRTRLLDAGLALGTLGRVAVEERQRLLENAHLRIAPRAGEGFGEVVFGRLAGRVASRCQRERIALTGHDRTQDGLAGHCGYRASRPNGRAWGWGWNAS